MAIMEREPLPDTARAESLGAKKTGLFVVDTNNVAQDGDGHALWDEYVAEIDAVAELFTETPAASFIVSDTIWDRSEDFMKDLRFSSLIVGSRAEAESLLRSDTGLPVIAYLNGDHGNDLVRYLDEILLVTLNMALPESDKVMTGPDLAGWTATKRTDGVRSVIRLIDDPSFMHAPTSFARYRRF